GNRRGALSGADAGRPVPRGDDALPRRGTATERTRHRPPPPPRTPRVHYRLAPHLALPHTTQLAGSICHRGARPRSLRHAGTAGPGRRTRGNAMKHYLAIAIVTVAIFAWGIGLATADVVVISNRARGTMSLEVAELNSPTPWTVRIASGESSPIFSDRPVTVAFDSGRGVQRYTLDLNCVYFLGSRDDGTVDLQKIGLNETPLSNMGRLLPGSAATTPAAVIPVKLLVDEEE